MTFKRFNKFEDIKDQLNLLGYMEGDGISYFEFMDVCDGLNYNIEDDELSDFSEKYGFNIG